MSENKVYRPPSLNKGPFLSFGGALILSALIFLALPLTQLLSSLNKPPGHQVMNEVSLPPPPAPPPEPPPEEEEEEEEEKPELQEEVQPLDLSQLDVALNPGVGDALNVGGAIAQFGVTPDTIQMMDIFELKDLDNNPRRLVAIPPIYPFQFKREGIEGWVKLVVIIDERGKVIRATIKESSHREFEKPSIESVLQWKFEPGTKNGKPVKVRRIQPLSFKLN